jgi:hypothetical protein
MPKQEIIRDLFWHIERMCGELGNKKWVEVYAHAETAVAVLRTLQIYAKDRKGEEV